MQTKVPCPRGRVRLSQVLPSGHWIPLTGFRSNLIPFDWGEIAARRFSGSAPEYVVRTMYLEYENVALPGDAVAAPAPARNENVTYYQGLSSPRDYLRVPMIATEIKSSDETGETAPKNNIAVFHAQSSGILGENGLSFSDTVNSKVYGSALVASPDQGDPGQDLLLARFYFIVAEQQLKLPTSQVGITWEVEFE